MTTMHEQHQNQNEEETVILAALSSLSPPHLSALTLSLLSVNLRQHRRVSCLLSSSALFSLTLHHLHSLSLSQKTHLIARHLLSSLHHLTLHLLLPPPPTPLSSFTTTRDLDAVLLLLLLCETHRHHPDVLSRPYAEWRVALRCLYADSMLTLSGIGSTLITYVDTVTRCRRLVKVMRRKKEVAASPAAVVALPAVEVKEGGVECVICKEEMRRGRDVCEMPCQHRFHWMCILPWLKKTNTCPCCRFQLPSDDVLGEIERLWTALVKATGADTEITECK